MTNIGYVRVSSIDQNTERQLDGIDLERVFEDKASGGSTDRPQLRTMLDYVREGDTIHVHSIDRLARSLRDLQDLIEDLANRGVAIQFHKEGLTFDGTPSPFQTLQLQVIGAVAEFERSIIRERQREGIAKAKARGVYVWRRMSELRPTAKRLGIATNTMMFLIDRSRGWKDPDEIMLRSLDKAAQKLLDKRNEH